MGIADLLRTALYFVHLGAATAWIGGSFFYLVVVRPAAAQLPEAVWHKSAAGRLRASFKELVEMCIILLVVTGAVMTFDRLSVGAAGPVYAALLGLKIALAVWAFLLVTSQWRRARRRNSDVSPDQAATGTPKPAGRQVAPELTVVLGIAIFFLASVLRVLYETALRG